MTSPNGPLQRWRVVVSAHLAKVIDQLHDQAVQAEKGKEFLEAFSNVQNSLQTDPRAFGDPLYPLPGMQLLVYGRAIFPIIVDYAVHDSEPLVFIKGVRLLGIP